MPKLTSAEKDQREWLTIKKLFKLACYLFFASYLLYTGMHAVTWAELTYYKYQPAEKVLDRAFAAHEAQKTDEAFALIRVIPLEQSSLVVDRVAPFVHEFPLYMKGEMARRTKFLGEEKEAAFWGQLQRFALQVDLLRCQSPARDRAKELMMEMMKKDDYFNMLTDEESLRENLKRVLAWDEKNPPTHELPLLCAGVEKMARDGVTGLRPEKEWRFDYLLLRGVTEKRSQGEEVVGMEAIVKLVREIEAKEEKRLREIEKETP
jgi:hypothetical protein